MNGNKTFSRLSGLIVLLMISIQFSVSRAQELLPYPLDTINGEEVYRYEVERSIGLYRIGVNFHVPQADIIRLNPQLRERGLHFGETLYIPTGRPVVIAEQPAETTPQPVADPVVTKADSLPKQAEEPQLAMDSTHLPSDSVALAADSTLLPADSLAHDSLHSKGNVVELALLLPFESKQTKRSPTAERMIEFYQGALLALHDIQNDSILYRLRVFDTERSERRINTLCDSTELDSVQGVLGVVYPIQIERMASWCETHQVPLLLPFSDDIDLRSRPQLLQFNATDTQEADSLCAWIVARDSMTHCVTIDVKDADLSPTIRTLRKQMKKRSIRTTGLALKNLIADSAFYALDQDKENLIIMHSDRYQHVRIILPHLSKLQDMGYRIRIVSQYSWQKENIDLPQVYTSMFTSDADREAYETLWEQAYVTHHTADAPRFDLLGYDLMRTLVAWLQGQQETAGLQSDIRWVQIENGGYQNANVKVIEK